VGIVRTSRGSIPYARELLSYIDIIY